MYWGISSREAGVAISSCANLWLSAALDAFSCSTCRRSAAALSDSCCQRSGTPGDPILSRLFLTYPHAVVQIAQERVSCAVDIFFQLTSSRRIRKKTQFDHYQTNETVGTLRYPTAGTATCGNTLAKTEKGTSPTFLRN